MLTPFEILDIARFAHVRSTLFLGAGYGNLLVHLHVGATARLSTTNIAGDMVRETLELAIRRNEQKQHTRKVRCKTIGARIING